MKALLAPWRRLPRAAKACALVAVLNSLVWAVLIPPFHVPDEPVHFAYTQHLAETGNPPRPVDKSAYSSEAGEALQWTFLFGVIGSERDAPIWSDVQQRRLDEALAADLPRDNGGGMSSATNNPVLYYALEAVPYGLASSGDVLDRLMAMRLLSVLLAGVTVLFTFLFLRELLPGTPRAWTAGALVAAFQPMFGFMSGGVNNDNLMFATAAILLFALVRALRRGLDVRGGAAIGAALGLGVISKATLVGFVPAVLFALAWLVWRAGAARPAALRGALAAAACTAAPVLLYIGLNLAAWDRPVWSGTAQYGAGLAGQGAAGNFGDQLAYLWQSYLPRLPFMQDMFPGYFPLWETWFKGFFGRFGWLDYDFPIWVYTVALVVCVVLLGLVAVELWRSRAALRRRWAELVCCLLAVGGLTVVIGVAGYGAHIQGQGFEQARYLLPLLPLYAALIALAARAGGRRFGPLIGVAVVGLAMSLGVFGQLITIARYYG
jgi:4-amino-4-deoxy-L-arabinose transferase-like glycosyltransferase